MERTVALLLGIAAWLGVAVASVLVVNAWSDENQIVAFIPIAAAVGLAWLVGYGVTRLTAPRNVIGLLGFLHAKRPYQRVRVQTYAAANARKERHYGEAR
jgi:hypothetical protein